MEPVLLDALCRPDPARDQPLPAQIYRDLMAAIRAGRLAAGVRLPSSRAASAMLGVSRITVNTAYDLLRAEGLVEIRPGAAPVVLTPRLTAPSDAGTGQGVRANGAAPPLSERGRGLGARWRRGERRDSVMAPGQPDEALFPRDLWARHLRRAARKLYGPAIQYGEPHGLGALRQALATGLARDRGVVAEAERLIITPGTQASMALLARLCADPGDVAALENPGYGGARMAFAGAGLRLAPVPVDGHGLCVAAIPAAARLIYVTPSKQYPMGARMALTRRRALIAHALRHNALILEDDYDSEFHWRGREIAALAAEPDAGGQIAYLGTASKLFLPGLRLGWAVLPDALIEPARAAQRQLGLSANLHAQAALAAMMEEGSYRTHRRRIRRAYAARGQALAEALRAALGDQIALRLPDGGVQLALRFTPPRPEAPVIAALNHAGFHPNALSAYWLAEPPGVGAGAEGAPSGLLIGFADATPARIADFTACLCDALGGGAGTGRGASTP